MGDKQISFMKHALKNGNRFYTESDNPEWNDLIEKGYATKRSGWEEGMSYFSLTFKGEKALMEVRNG